MNTYCFKFKHYFAYFFIILVFKLGYPQRNINPPKINQPLAMPDINMVQHGDKVYAFSGTDIIPYNDTINTFVMPYWRCYSSSDLINWSFESMLRPEDTYIGKSDKCFAGHGIERNGKWYWYFSNFVKNVGVAVSDSPKGPWRDVLKNPLLPENLTVTHEYDPCAFIDDDGRAYLTFGSHKDKKLHYYIVELNDDMISLKGEPKLLEVKSMPYGKGHTPPVDASFLHKNNGLYYLSWRSPYAISKNILGPYQYIGEGPAYGHLGYFKFNNQWFANFTTLKENEGMRKRYRFGSLIYIHFNDDGSMAKTSDIIFEHGVGQYDSEWDRIEAEWYMKLSNRPHKKNKKDGGFQIVNFHKGDFVNFPNIHNIKRDASAEIKYASTTNGTIIVKFENENGMEYGRAEFKSTGSWDNFETLEVPFNKNPPGTISISFVVDGEAKKELIRIDSFKITP